jgi:RNA polymerase sigma-70 factor (ECF subfamily)
MTVLLDHDNDELAELASGYRRELLAHCYRMLGSVHDAEDLVQESLLRAWQGRDGFEHRSSLRVWLYKIATNACLRALERRQRLPLPSGLGAPSPDPQRPLAAPPPGHQWLEPIPDQWISAAAPTDPAAQTLSRERVRLAFVSALLHLSARQRAVLILRDVLAFSARETAEILETTTPGVNSALLRARSQLAALPSSEEPADPTEPGPRERLEEYVTAFEQADIARLVRVLREDVVLEMPPYATWFAGREHVGRFMAAQVLTKPGRVRMLPIAANGQPAFAVYSLGRNGAYYPMDIHVLSLTETGISRLEVFLDRNVFELFGLPPVLA